MKCCLLENSEDELTQQIYSRRRERLKGQSSRWLASNELQKLEPVVDHTLRFAGQTGRTGLGFLNSKYIADPSIRQRRQKLTEALTAQREERRMRHASCLARQGVWTNGKM